MPATDDPLDLDRYVIEHGRDPAAAEQAVESLSRRSRYDGDPLIEARKTHSRLYRHHPDGPCCQGCEATSEQHVTFPCAVVQQGRCDFEVGAGDWNAYRCILAAGHREPDRHLVENRAGMRMIASPVGVYA